MLELAKLGFRRRRLLDLVACKRLAGFVRGAGRAVASLAFGKGPAAPPRISPVTVVSDGKMFRGILNVVARAVEGERNHVLFWAACRFAESTLARDDATALLINAALQVGLPTAEARPTINSAYRRLARGG